LFYLIGLDTLAEALICSFVASNFSLTCPL